MPVSKVVVFSVVRDHTSSKFQVEIQLPELFVTLLVVVNLNVLGCYT